MCSWKTIADIRREYGELSLSLSEAADTPFEQFKCWFEQVLQTEKSDPTAMVLSTIDEQGHPDSRVVLLKGIEDDAFVFYTNYQSSKAQQLDHQPYAALNFYWPQMARQVRIRGMTTRISAEQSDSYFSSRPVSSQFSAIASPQSREIASRKHLEQRLNELIEKYGQQPIIRPEFWGGYQLMPDDFEFWQGRDNRLHDRIHYFSGQGQWQKRRLAP